jgi:SAM-dependent methyltransferase
MFCKLCKKNTKKKLIKTRSNKKSTLFFCKDCDFEFFKFNPEKNLKNNKLDISRLQKAGLKIPKRNQDFLNGLEQSKLYIKKFLNVKKKLKILEVGCSWGYFLYLTKKIGHSSYGLELNNIRVSFIEKILKIVCKNNLNYYENNLYKFDRIFLFYSFEYINDPLIYISRLYRLLNKNGQIILITPNKNDILKKTLLIKSYNNFFYDDNSVNYFSVKSLKKVVILNKIKRFSVALEQGYSLINFFNWFNFNKPFFTGSVGEDKYVDKTVDHLSINLENKNSYKGAIKSLIRLIKKSSISFKNIAIKNNLANKIVLKIFK